MPACLTPGRFMGIFQAAASICLCLSVYLPSLCCFILRRSRLGLGQLGVLASSP